MRNRERSIYSINNISDNKLLHLLRDFYIELMKAFAYLIDITSNIAYSNYYQCLSSKRLGE